MNIDYYTAEDGRWVDIGWMQSRQLIDVAGHGALPVSARCGSLTCFSEAVIAPRSKGRLQFIENEELVIIPLCGYLKYRDSQGYSMALTSGEVLVVRSGCGIGFQLSNECSLQELRFLLIRAKASGENDKPQVHCYDVRSQLQETSLLSVLAPQALISLSQPLHLSLGTIRENWHDDAQELDIKIAPQAGLALSVISGELVAGSSLPLQAGDSVVITEAESVKLRALSDCQFLLLELPRLSAAVASTTRAYRGVI
jgi:redox-sensitive bicupin YhaK (pirin superfamily)